MKTTKTIVIVGNGIASWRVNAELEKKFIDLNIIRIGSEDFIPKCSYRTTAINCLRGVQKGISKLGDLMYDSHVEFEAFYEESRPDGVNVGYEWQFWDPNGQNSEKWQRRFKDWDQFKEIGEFQFSKTMNGVRSKAYIIEPKRLYKWHSEKFEKTQFINDYVVEINNQNKKHIVRTQKGNVIEADAVVICTGYMAHNFLELVTEESVKDYLKRSKPVRGTYLQTQYDLGDDSFSLALEGSHLIYRASDKNLLIGSSSQNDSSIQIPMEKEVNDIFEFVTSQFSEWKLPSRENWKLQHGIRFKGAKRTPFWGTLSSRCYGVMGLYKNAFSFSFLAAKELSQEIYDDLEAK